MDNYQDVLHQMEQFGIAFRDKDLPLQIDTPKRKTCGDKSKDWYKLHTFQPRTGGSLIVGTFGTYRHGGDWAKVQIDWQPLSDAEKARHQAERDAAAAKAAEVRRQEAEIAALDARELWQRATPTGTSPYLQRKGVEGESCRYLPNGTVVIPMIRYDLDRSAALKACQRILPDGSKYFSKGFQKPGTAVRLGPLPAAIALVLVCEGYATGLTLRAATSRLVPVFCAFDAGGLVHVVPIVRELFAEARILICADDDWRTKDATGKLINPGRTMAAKVAKEVSGCDIVWPVFAPAMRQAKDTDFNDLAARQGLEVVRQQLHGVIEAMEKRYG